MTDLINPDRKCSVCKLKRMAINFSLKPSICDYCLSDPEYLRLRAIKIQRAGDAIRSLFDAKGIPSTVGTAPKMTELLASFFEKWGGQEQFMADVVKHGKDLLEKKPLAYDTTRFLSGMLKLVNEDNKREDQLEIARMSDDQIKRELQLAAMDMFLSAELVTPARLMAVKQVLEAFDLPSDDPDVVAEVQDAAT